MANSEIDRLDRWRLEVEPLPEGERHPRASGRGRGIIVVGGTKGEDSQRPYIYLDPRRGLSFQPGLAGSRL